MPSYIDRNDSRLISAPGASGNVLTSDGANWVSVPSSLAPIRSITVPIGSAVSTVDIEDSFTAYPTYMIIGYNLRPTSANSILNARLRVGTTYQTSSSYQGVNTYFRSQNTSTFIEYPTSYMAISGGTLSSTTTQTGMFVLRLMNPVTSGVFRSAMWDFGSTNTGSGATRNMGYGAWIGSTDPLTGIRFYFDSTTTAAGTFQLYGVRGA